MLSGSCLCGAVRYEIAGRVHDVHHCHCGMCRKAHGGGFSTFGRVTASELRFTAGADQVRRFRSSTPIERSFCGTCGSRLTFRFDGMPDATWITLGTLDDDPGVQPDAHIFVASKASWDAISDALPQYPEYPPFGDESAG